MDTIRKIRHFLGAAMFPLPVFPCEYCLQPSAATSWSCRTGDCRTRSRGGTSATGEEVARSPGGGTCGNGMGSARDVPSCSHLVLSLLFVSLSRMGFAGTPVPCSAIPEGLLKADKIHIFIHSWFFTHREAPPVQEGGKHWSVLCPISIHDSQFAILSVHLWRLLSCEAKE